MASCGTNHRIHHLSQKHKMYCSSSSFGASCKCSGSLGASCLCSSIVGASWICSSCLGTSCVCSSSAGASCICSSIVGLLVYVAVVWGFLVYVAAVVQGLLVYVAVVWGPRHSWVPPPVVHMTPAVTSYNLEIETKQIKISFANDLSLSDKPHCVSSIHPLLVALEYASPLFGF